MMPMAFNLRCDDFGRLLLTMAGASEEEEVQAVRAYPISAPLEGIALVSLSGEEKAWIEQLDALPTPMREQIEAALGAREFMPEILHLHTVSSFATPCTWHVDTDRGSTRFVLKGEEDIRRLPDGILLIADAHGIQFMIRKLSALDRHSRRLLDRFL
jgi:hypothetical protein